MQILLVKQAQTKYPNIMKYAFSLLVPGSKRMPQRGKCHFLTHSVHLSGYPPKEPMLKQWNYSLKPIHKKFVKIQLFSWGHISKLARRETDLSAKNNRFSIQRTCDFDCEFWTEISVWPHDTKIRPTVRWKWSLETL